MDTIETSFILDSCFACEEVFLPNAFSPNGDGINDLFGATTICPFDTFTLRIFNRWGTKVFETNEVGNLWDGTFKGKTCPPDAYIYTLSYRAIGRSNKLKSGRVLIVR
jgi:gliding motility-associated-like protein